MQSFVNTIVLKSPGLVIQNKEEGTKEYLCELPPSWYFGKEFYFLREGGYFVLGHRAAAIFHALHNQNSSRKNESDGVDAF